MSLMQMKPSEMPAGHWLDATCLKCGDYRYLGRQFLIDHGGDVPLQSMHHRIRCVARPLDDKRGPACGGAMELALDGPRPD